MASPAPVSLCMIVRNEEHNLRSCLTPVARLVDEVVVVDTGSTDGTKARAAEFGARVIDFKWCDDFAAARNESLRWATRDWVMWLDADDRLDAANLQRLAELLTTLGDEEHAYFMNTVSGPQLSQDTAVTVPHCRLFRRHPQVRWARRVHEQIVPSIERLGHQLVCSDVCIQHIGYQDAALYHRKANRNLRLLRMEFAVDPTDPVTLFNLGLENMGLGRYADALTFLLASLKHVRSQADWTRRLYALLCDALVKLDRHSEALAMTRDGLACFPNDPVLVTRRAQLLVETGHLEEAERYLLQLLRGPAEYQRCAGEQAIVDRRQARSLLGRIYEEQGRPIEAERVFQELLAQHPTYVEGWVGLSYVYFAQQRHGDVEYVARQLEKCGHGSVYASIVRAESHMLRNEFAQARALLNATILQTPQMVWPRIVLGDLLMRSGAPLSECVAAQRDILRMDPGNFAAKSHLERMLREQSGQSAPAWFCVTA